MTLRRILFVFIPFQFVSFICLGQQLISNYKPNIATFSPPIKSLTDELLSSSSEEVKSHPEFGILPYNAPCRDCYEQIEKRTAFERYFVKKGTGGKGFYVQKSYTPLHYMDKTGRWMTIDPHFRQVGDKKFSAERQPYPTVIDLDKGYTSITRNDSSIFFNQQVKMYYTSGAAKFGEQSSSNDAFYTAGNDGVEQRNFFPGVYRQLIAGKGSIETNYILIHKPDIPAQARWVVIEDTWTLPAGYSMATLEGGYITVDGLWAGDIIVKDETGREVFRIRQPLLIQTGAGRETGISPDVPVGYKIVHEGNEWGLSLMVSAKWLTAWNRIYPVTIDPLVTTTQDYTGTYGGSAYSASCANLTNTSCGYTIGISVPGGSTIMNAGFTASYETSYSSCNCHLENGSFYLTGPCGKSYDTLAFLPWTCGNDTIGTCSTASSNNTLGAIYEYKMVDCLPPSCSSRIIPFTLYLTHCSCNSGITCDTSCIYLSDYEIYSIVVEGLTVQTNAATSTGAPSASICPGSSVTLEDTTNYGVPPYTYLWSPGGQTTSSVSVSPNSTTNYTVVATDACGNSTSSVVPVTTYPLAQVAQPNQSIQIGSSAQLNATGGQTFTWSPDNSLNDSTISNPIATPTVTTTYTVVATDPNNCVDSSTAVVNVYPISQVIFPNAFSPNNDGINDVFEGYYNAIQSVDLQIYNRWGQLVFETQSLSQGWDGKFNGLDSPIGVYIYVVKAITVEGTEINKKGSFALLR